MKINASPSNMKKIALHNYRCFEYLQIDFADKINILIGDNSSGKTTIIRAVGAALSSYFSGFSDSNTRFSGLAKEDFRINTSSNLILTTKNIE